MVRNLLLVFCACCLGVSGCGPQSNLADITGTVTIDGAAPKEGSISFIPLDGKAPTTGAVIEEGKYVSQVPIGESKVEIRIPKVVGKKKLYDTADSPEQEIMAEVLPSKYNEESELRVTAERGENTKNWELSTK